MDCPPDKDIEPCAERHIQTTVTDGPPGPAPALAAAAEFRCLARHHDQLYGKRIRYSYVIRPLRDLEPPSPVR